MFFEKDGNTYGIKFYYEGHNRTTTVAELVEVSDEGVVHTGIVGIASLDSRDRFVKKIGRRLALTHLLEALSDEAFVEENGGVLLIRKDRAQIWNQYLNRGRG